MQLGYVDTPTDNQIISDVFVVSGWCVSELDILKIEVLVNDFIAGEAIYGDQRKGIDEVIPNIPDINVGFHYSLDTTKFLSGDYTIKIRVVLSDDTEFMLNKSRVTISNFLLSVIDLFAENQYYLKKRLEGLKKGASILIACMPKSGSTFLTTVLKDLTGFTNYPLVYTYSQNEQDIYLPRLIDAYTKNTVTQQHVRATVPNKYLMQLFDIKPVILTRNLFDIVVSYYDHIHNESLEVPAFYINDHFFKLSQSEKIDLIINMAMPWYFSFYSSWYDVSQKNEIDVLWVSYEELISDRIKTVNKVMNFYNIPTSNQEILNILEASAKKQTRKNVGVFGRGEYMLSEVQKERIRSYKNHYPWVDFSVLGI